MAHNHSHHGGESISNVKLAFLLNFGFAILEIFGGIFTQSTAILSDAVHDFGDSLALGLSYIFEKVGKKNPTEQYTYGFKRLSLIGAFINIIILSIGTVFVLMEAIKNLMNPKVVVAEGMFILAIIGVLVNGLSVFKMKGSKRILDKTVMMHLLEDLLGWIAVMIVSVFIYFTDWYFLDSILSFVICIMIGKNIVDNITTAISIIMQAVPDRELYAQIKEQIILTDGVESIIKSNIWTLDGEYHIFTATIKISEQDNRTLVLKAVKSLLEDNHVYESTIELL